MGSSSVRLVVFDGAARSPAYFYNEKLSCSLGVGLSTTGKLNPEGKLRTVEAIRRFKYLTASMGIKEVTAVATAAVRSAKDGIEFCYHVYEETGQKIWIIDGITEARLSAQGILLGWPRSCGLVCDIGGSSMELAQINFGQVGRLTTSDLGPLNLRELEICQAERRKYISKTLKKLAKDISPKCNRLFLVGGSWRTLAKVDMYRTNYPLKVLHEYRMCRKSVSKTIAYTHKIGTEILHAKYNLDPLRLELLPYAGEVLMSLLFIFELEDIVISSYGLREGLLFQQMSDTIRSRDPLIEACKVAEKKEARVPGMGKALYKFVLPLFTGAGKDLLRIIRAACLLHDVSWRANPDYRAEVCFDNATRSNLGGLKHSERIFLGLALMYRYTNRRDERLFASMGRIIDEDSVKLAEILGKAMRLGAMIWLADDPHRAKLFWDPEKDTLTLELSGSSSALFGEVADARLQSLAKTLSARGVCTFFG